MVNGVIRIGKMKIEYFCFRFAEKKYIHTLQMLGKARDIETESEVGFGLVSYEKKKNADKMGLWFNLFSVRFSFRLNNLKSLFCFIFPLHLLPTLKKLCNFVKLFDSEHQMWAYLRELMVLENNSNFSFEYKRKNRELKFLCTTTYSKLMNFVVRHECWVKTVKKKLNVTLVSVWIVVKGEIRERMDSVSLRSTACVFSSWNKLESHKNHTKRETETM